ncbi:MAG: hypothetical protein HOJ35_01410 [Bdellovibrionales bacterium]|nr:hypothetical protein [Bdellovibrionales bacterium]
MRKVILLFICIFIPWICSASTRVSKETKELVRLCLQKNGSVVYTSNFASDGKTYQEFLYQCQCGDGSLLQPKTSPLCTKSVEQFVKKCEAKQGRSTWEKNKPITCYCADQSTINPSTQACSVTQDSQTALCISKGGSPSYWSSPNEGVICGCDRDFRFPTIDPTSQTCGPSFTETCRNKGGRRYRANKKNICECFSGNQIDPWKSESSCSLISNFGHRLGLENSGEYSRRVKEKCKDMGGRVSKVGCICQNGHVLPNALKNTCACRAAGGTSDNGTTGCYCNYWRTIEPTVTNCDNSAIINNNISSPQIRPIPNELNNKNNSQPQ